MCQLSSSILGKKNLFGIFALFFIAVFAIGGCNDNNGGGVDAPDPEMSACTILSALSPLPPSPELNVSAAFMNVPPPVPEVQSLPLPPLPPRPPMLELPFVGSESSQRQGCADPPKVPLVPPPSP